MSTVWFTSDLHLGHAKVAQHRAEAFGAPAVAARPQHAINWHDRHLAWNWDDSIADDDQVWVLGDLSLGGTEATAYALNWIADRPGEKHLVPGNHCPVHPMHRDAHKWQSAYLKVFASVQPFARRRIAGRSVLLSHFPYRGDHTTEERFNQYRLRDEGEWLLHGHTHSVARYAAFQHPRQVHVGVDAWDFQPVHIDSVAEIIERESALWVPLGGTRPIYASCEVCAGAFPWFDLTAVPGLDGTGVRSLCRECFWARPRVEGMTDALIEMCGIDPDSITPIFVPTVGD